MVRFWILAVIFMSSPVAAGKMRMCKDANGKVTFTQTSGPKNTDGRNIYVAPAQSPISKLRATEVMELGRIQQVSKSRQQPRQQSKPKVRSSCPNMR